MTPHTGINWPEVGIIAGLFVTIGTILLGAASKIFKFGKVSQRLDHIEKDLDETVKPELKTLRGNIVSEAKAIHARLDDILKSFALKQVSKSESPRTLNQFGEKVLKDSSIHSIIEPKLDDILKRVKANNPENPYQVQEMLIDIVQELKSDPAIKNDIEQAAFKSGVIVDTVLLVGAIDIRDIVLEKLDMKPDDIDKHKPGK